MEPDWSSASFFAVAYAISSMLNGGKRYTLNVTFTNNSVNVNSVGIESAWDDDTEDREFDTV